MPKATGFGKRFWWTAGIFKTELMIKNACVIALCLGLNACHSTKQTASVAKGASFDFEGHRGGRGLMPENTIPAMKKGMDLGITTVELDAVISKDKKVVVSHDPYFNEAITTTPDGGYLTKKEGEALLLYGMNYDVIRTYDVGLKPYPAFPQQRRLKAHKPLLSELIDSVEAYAKEKRRTIRYNIEIKSKEGFDGIRHPDPQTMSELVLAVIKEKGILNRVVIQSFDVRPLQYLHKTHPDVMLSYLTEKTAIGLDEQLNQLGFVPAVYSPAYVMVTKETVEACHRKGMKVLPWTVNSVPEMKALIAMGVDGIISDYPNLFAQLGIGN